MDRAYLEKRGHYDQPHYSPETRAWLFSFQYANHKCALMYADKVGAIERATFAQEAWNRLARSRRNETGTGFYLTPEEYEKAVNDNSR